VNIPLFIDSDSTHGVVAKALALERLAPLSTEVQGVYGQRLECEVLDMGVAYAICTRPQWSSSSEDLMCVAGGSQGATGAGYGKSENSMCYR
jgi:hypothetical protein